MLLEHLGELLLVKLLFLVFEVYFDLLIVGGDVRGYRVSETLLQLLLYLLEQLVSLVQPLVLELEVHLRLLGLLKLCPLENRLRGAFQACLGLSRRHSLLLIILLAFLP